MPRQPRLVRPSSPAAGRRPDSHQPRAATPGCFPDSFGPCPTAGSVCIAWPPPAGAPDHPRAAPARPPDGQDGRRDGWSPARRRSRPGSGPRWSSTPCARPSRVCRGHHSAPRRASRWKTRGGWRGSAWAGHSRFRRPWRHRHRWRPGPSMPYTSAAAGPPGPRLASPCS